MAYTPNGAFNFTDTTYTPDGDYVFGVVVENNIGNFDITVESASGNLVGYLSPVGDFDVNVGDAVATFVGNRYDYQGQFAVQVEDCVAGIIGNYDPNVNRATRYHTNYSTVEEALNLPPVKTCFATDQGTPLFHAVRNQQEKGTLLFDCTLMVTFTGTFISQSYEFTYEEGTYLSNSACFVYEQGTFIDHKKCFAYEAGTFITDGLCSTVQQMTKIYPNRWEMVNQDSNKQIDFLHPVMLEPLPPFNYTPNGDFDFNDTSYTPDGDFEFAFGRPSNLYVRHTWGPLTSSVCGSWNTAQVKNVKKCSVVEETKQPDPGITTWIDLPRPDPDPDPPSGETITVPIQEVYPVLNTITVTLDDDVTPIHMDNINLSIDADSSAWSFDGVLLDPDDRDSIKQLPNGTPVKLHVTINGYVWHVVVERIQTNREFAKHSIKVTGRGLTSLLSKPYEQPVSVNVGTDLDIRVLVDNILPLGWNDLGSLYWLLGDDPAASPISWIVPGGAYSYQNKTPSEAIKELCEDIGVMMVPSRNSQEIFFKSRYTVLPWNFSGVSVDVAIPDAAITRLTEEPVSSFQANGVYVHGNEVGGELAFVRLNGTAGDRLAPTVNNSLMTDLQGLTSLGQRILSGQYEQPKIKSITTFMDGTTVPLIDLGDFVGLTVDGVETKGVVNAVSISATLTDVSQTITMGETTPNAWVAFKEILPKDPMLVGTLSSTDTVTSLMTLLDGGVLRVRGTGTVGNKYYIRSGEIVSDAPDLTQYEIIL